MPKQVGTPVRVTEPDRLSNRTHRLKDQEADNLKLLTAVLATGSVGRTIALLISEKLAQPHIVLAVRQYKQEHKN